MDFYFLSRSSNYYSEVFIICYNSGIVFDVFFLYLLGSI